jgi:hypothetical protein
LNHCVKKNTNGDDQERGQQSHRGQTVWEGDVEVFDLLLPFLIGLIGNGSVAVFYYAFWLLGWWIPALEDFYDANSRILPAFWFVSFFAASFLSINPCIKKPVFSIFISLGLAFGFSLLLYILICVSSLLLAPLLDPMF